MKTGFHFNVLSIDSNVVLQDVQQVFERVEKLPLDHGVTIRLLKDLPPTADRFVTEIRSQITMVRSPYEGLNFFGQILVFSPEFYDDPPLREIVDWLRQRQRG
jgi:hypothetical protein